MENFQLLYSGRWRVFGANSPASFTDNVLAWLKVFSIISGEQSRRARAPEWDMLQIEMLRSSIWRWSFREFMLVSGQDHLKSLFVKHHRFWSLLVQLVFEFVHFSDWFATWSVLQAQIYILIELIFYHYNSWIVVSNRLKFYTNELRSQSILIYI